jgi:hypothetical protein
MNVENELYDVDPEPLEPEPLESPSAAPPSGPLDPLSPSEERTWAMLAHLSVLLNLVTGFVGLATALIIYLIYRDRSRYVAFQALQAFIFQAVFWAAPGLVIGILGALAGIMWAVVGTLSAILVGVLLIPLAVLVTFIALLVAFALVVMPVAAVVYGVVGGIQTNEGKDFRYWLVDEWTLNLID